MECFLNRLENICQSDAPYSNYVIAEEKEKISPFNVIEYTPLLGTVIGSAEVIYGVTKIAFEIIRGSGNHFLKNSEYNFKKELGSGVGTLGRGLALMFPSNHRNAITLLSAENLTERDLDIAQKYAKKLPYMNNEELDLQGVGR